MVFIAVVPLSINLFFDLFSLNTRLKENIHKNFLVIGENEEREIDVLLKSRYTDLLLLSENPIFTSSESSIEEKLKEMTKVQEYYKYFEDITLINASGTKVLSTTYRSHLDFEKTSWFAKAVKGNGIITSPYLALGGDRLISTSWCRSMTGMR